MDTMPLQAQTKNIHCVMFKDDMVSIYGIPTLINASSGCACAELLFVCRNINAI